jgi:uncharacterized integral membrane protein
VGRRYIPNMADGQKAAKGGDGKSGVSWKTIVLIVLAIYAFVLIILNSKQVKVDFVFFHARTRVFYLVLLSMALGALIMWLVPRFRRSRAGGDRSAPDSDASATP